MPTFCALAGYKADRPLQWDGIDLTALLTERRALPERALYAVAPSWRARSVRLGDWKLIVHGTGESRRFELFNLANDPAEANNLATREPERTASLLARMEAMAAADRDAVAKR